MFWENYMQHCNSINKSPNKVAYEIGCSSGSVTAWKNGRIPKWGTLLKIADYFGVTPDSLIGDAKSQQLKFRPPNITEEYTTFPVIGEIAAGYDHIAMEDWCGDTVDIPDSYLRGHSLNDYFVLRVHGDSMYPIYQDGDKVLVLKQSTLNASGDVGVILYDDELATLKKVEYVQGEDWLKLIPLNPTYKPELIEGERVAHCRVIGIPRLLIREIN